MSGNRKRRRKSILKSRFYQVYFALVALALVVIAVGTVWLNGMLKDYEAAQPKYVAQTVAQLFEDGDYDAICALDTAAQALSDGDRALYADTLREMTRDGEIRWSEVFSADSDERKYAVSLDGERFATFTLVPSGKTDARGNRLWAPGGVTTNVTLQEATPEPTPEPTPAVEAQAQTQTWTCQVTAPKGYAVAVDGTSLDGSNAQIVERRLFEDGFLPEGVENPTLVDYTFEWANANPTVTATDEGGNGDAALRVPDKALAWEYPLPEDGESQARFSDAAIALGKQVAKYISQDGRKKSIQKICVPGSPAEAIFDNLSNTFTTPHTGVDIRDAAASRFYRLSDDCFTCHVSFNYVLHTKQGDRTYPTEYTFCVISADGKYGLYNMLSF